MGRRAYLLIGLMITCYSFTRKRESCQGVDHSIPSDIIDPNTKCEGSMYIGAGLARWRRAQQHRRAQLARVNTHIYTLHQFTPSITLIYVCVYVDLRWSRAIYTLRGREEDIVIL